MSARRRYFQTTELPSSIFLNPCRGWMSVVRPVARTNLITNPSFETATTNYTAVGGSIARSTTQQYHGAYSLAVTPGAGTTDGVFYGTVSLTSGTTYAASCKFYGPAGIKYKISFATTGGVDLAAYTFTATGRWQWVWVYWTETSTTTRRIYVTKSNSTGTGVFYIDGVQVEAIVAGETVSTYIDGDQQSLFFTGQFPPAYGWNGARHASTSFRSAQTRDGGMVKNLDAYQLYVHSISGLGIVNPSHIVTAQPLVDGAAYQTSTLPPREVHLRGRFSTESNIQLKQARKALGAALNLDATTPRSPVVFFYQEHDGVNAIGDVAKLAASIGGLDGQWDNLTGEDVDLSLMLWRPFLIGGDSGAAITTTTTVGTSTTEWTVWVRSAAGAYSLLANASGNIAGATTITAMEEGFDGRLYVGGDFTSIGGTAANGIAVYDPTAGTWSAMGSGIAGGFVFQVIRGPNGDIYACGSFTSMGGVANTSRIARWDGSAWNALGTGLGSVGEDMAFGPDGLLYVVGQFTTAGGGAANRIASWSGSAWAALGAGLDNRTRCVAVTRGGLVYVGGDFANAGGGAAVRAAVWTISTATWAALSTGLDAFADTIAIGPDQSAYYGGDFTTAGGLTVNLVARWNGSDWQSLAGGLTGGTAIVLRLEFGIDGLLYAGGSLTTAGGITTSESYAIWNGSSWILPDTANIGNVTTLAFQANVNGKLYFAFRAVAAGAKSGAAVNTLTNNGTALTYPTFTITGPSSSTTRLHQIRNYTTGEILSFDLTIAALEEITIRCEAGLTVITSTFRGDISHLLLSGSAATCTLLRGSNAVAVFTTGSAITMVSVWPLQYASADDLVTG